MELGKWYFDNGRFEKAHLSLMPLAKSGQSDAQYVIGYMYYYGLGTNVNVSVSKYWFKRAAGQNYPMANDALVLMPTLEDKMIQDNKISALKKAPAPKVPVLPKIQSGGAKTVKKKIEAKSVKKELEPKPKMIKAKELTKVINKQLSQNEQVLKISQKKYSIQILASNYKSRVLIFAKQHNIEKKTKLYKTKFQGKPWYVLLFGEYENVIQAKGALKQLPNSLKLKKPYIKSYAQIHRQIIKENALA